jgi:ubiquinone/menaquinone biosynthesis C-methylase UbiE
LDTARRCEAQFHLGVEIVEANAEDVPLADASFDLAISEYGASISWAWIGEADRLLHGGGELVFLRFSTVAMLCMPATGQVTTTLQRPRRDLARIEWADDPAVEFHPAAGKLFRILRQSGFTVSDIIEVYAPHDP